MTDKELAELAYKAGFDGDQEYNGLSGNSELDELIYVGEYPCGEILKKFIELYLNLVV